MGKLIKTEELEKLTQSLDSRIKNAVAQEKDRAEAAEKENKDNIEEIETLLDIELHTHDNKIVLDNIGSNDISNWNAKSDFSGSYEDLENKPTSLPADGGNADTIGGISIWVGTQTQYNAITVKDNMTLYFIKG